MNKDGKIVRIKLTNFVTYDSLEFYPGHQFNCIIGPNGTGKSTILCAICLGLAGKPKVLGRAQNAHEFIKFGSSKALIEIELFNVSDENIVIRREITKNQVSTFTVNKRPARINVVEKLVANLNIQVDNLCQFLPQDKVSDFARMGPTDLLRSTEKAVGPPTMAEDHNSLNIAREKLKRLENATGVDKDLLESEIRKNERLKSEVDEYYARRSKMSKIETLQQKRLWVIFENEKNLFCEAKSRKDQLGNKLKEESSKFEPERKRIANLIKEEDNFNSINKKLTASINNSGKQVDHDNQGLQDLFDSEIEARENYKEILALDSKNKRKISELKKQISIIESEISSYDHSDRSAREMEEISLKTTDYQNNIAELHRKGNDLLTNITQNREQIKRINQNKEEIQNIQKRRLETLRGLHKDSYNAVIWLRQNKNLFKGEIHEPILLNINPNNPKFAKYIESSISNNDMRSFVCEFKEDQDKFLSVMRHEKNLRINIVRAPSESLSSYVPNKPIDNYNKYGFFSYLRELFSAPDLIMRYLCSLNRIHSIPVGDSSTRQKVELILKECKELTSFYTENHLYSIKRSRYSGCVSTSSSFLKNSSLLTNTVDTQLEEQLAQELAQLQPILEQQEGQYRSLQQNERDFQQSLNNLRLQKKTLMQKRNNLRNLQQRIEAKRESVNRILSNKIDLNKAKMELDSKLTHFSREKFKQQVIMQNNTKACFEIGFKKAKLALLYAQSVSQRRKLEQKSEEQRLVINKIQQDLDAVADECRRLKERTKTKYKEAQVKSGLKHNEQPSEKMLNAYGDFPDSLKEIESLLHTLQVQTECSFETSENVLLEYRERQTRIECLKAQINDKAEILDTHRQEVQFFVTKWLVPLQELISRINTNFKRFFREMNLAGEVELLVPPDPEDYASYGVRIMVAFREEEQLRELTGYHQSGGERSVSTVLYMMALQELTECPFRCVDEINQGMDPENERRVFDIIVRIASSSASQYFLLTPKLLPNLNYSPDLTLLTIFNGEKMLSYSKWCLEKFCRIKQCKNR